MKIIVETQRDEIIGRIAEIKKTAAGLHMPDDPNTRGHAVFILIDAVGADVTKYKAGEVIVPRKFDHIRPRGGLFHLAIVKEAEVAVRLHVDDAYLVVDQLPEFLGFDLSEVRPSNGAHADVHSDPDSAGALA